MPIIATSILVIPSLSVKALTELIEVVIEIVETVIKVVLFSYKTKVPKDLTIPTLISLYETKT